jgi:outer membrane receptor protein involved in Fe transport
VLFGTGFRGPTAWEVFSTTATRVPNLDLKPENLLTADIGIAYRLKRRYYFSVQAYFNQVSSLLVDSVPTNIPIPGTNSFYDQNQNTGGAQIVGVEGQTELRIVDQLTINANYTFSWGRYTGLQPALQSTIPVLGSDRVPNIARHHFNIGVTAHPLRTLTINLRGNYVGDRETIATNPERVIPGYFFVGVNVRWEDAFTVKGLYLDLAIRNLLNQQAFDPGIRDASGGYYPTRHPLEPINFWVSAGYTL